MQISIIIQENFFFAQGIGINKEFSSKTDTVFKVSFPHHFSAVGLSDSLIKCCFLAMEGHG